MGELFDHGADSLASMLQCVAMACALQLGGSWATWVMVFGVHTIFYFSIWEQYYTDVLRFSVIAGPTEALLGVIGIHLITGIFGTSFWMIQLSFLPMFGHLTIGQGVAIVFFLMLIPALRENITYVMNATLSTADLELKGGAIRSLIPWFLIVVFWNVWLLAGPVNLFSQSVVMTCSIFGLVIGYTIVFVIYF